MGIGAETGVGEVFPRGTGGRGLGWESGTTPWSRRGELGVREGPHPGQHWVTVESVCFEVRLSGANPGSVTWASYSNSEPWFPHLENRIEYNTHLTGWL